MEDIIIKVKGKEYKVKVEETNGKVKVHIGRDMYEVDTKSDIEPLFADIIKEENIDDDQKTIKSPLPGTIFSVNVKTGDKIKKGTIVVKLMAMKMENDITASKDCTVKEIKVKKNDNVNKGDVLILIK